MTDNFALSDVYHVYLAALMASPQLITPASTYFEDDDLFSFLPCEFLSLIDEANVPQPTVPLQDHSSPIKYRVSEQDNGLTFETYILDLALLVWHDNQYSPEDQLCVGLMNSHFNFERWVHSDGDLFSVGFSYIRTKKLDFTVKSSLCSPSYLHYLKFARRFFWDKLGFYKCKTNLPVAVFDGPRLFHETVEILYAKPVWRRQWTSLSPSILSSIVTYECHRFIPDAVVYAEFWLRHPPTHIAEKRAVNVERRTDCFVCGTRDHLAGCSCDGRGRP
ncbi:hypothetical protein L218DRAFT_1081006 [Marasmius fiardii PR-910]|nr:hypothetical protein L218DRAFT_1081006 [Marasmius fiardii PR-910]